jgi:hypothetical protein
LQISRRAQGIAPVGIALAIEHSQAVLELVVQEVPFGLKSGIAQHGRLGSGIGDGGDGADVQRVIAGRGLQGLAREWHQHESATHDKPMVGFPFHEGVLQDEPGT